MLPRDGTYKDCRHFATHLPQLPPCTPIRPAVEDKTVGVDHLEAAGDEFLNGKDRRVAERCWRYCRRVAELRSAERSVRCKCQFGSVMILETARVSLLACQNLMLMLISDFRHDYNVADAFRDHYLKKDVLGSWKTARDRVKVCPQQASSQA